MTPRKVKPSDGGVWNSQSEVAFRRLADVEGHSIFINAALPPELTTGVTYGCEMKYNGEIHGIVWQHAVAGYVSPRWSAAPNDLGFMGWRDTRIALAWMLRDILHSKWHDRELAKVPLELSEADEKALDFQL